MPSSMRPPPSTGAAIEIPAAAATVTGADQPDPPAIEAAAEALSAHGIFGLAWLDEALIVRATYGRLVEFLPCGAAVADSLSPLLGLEDDIRALKDTPDAALELPAVAIVGDGRNLPRLNILVVFLAERSRYLVCISRPTGVSGIESELARQMRFRLIAEAEVIAKSKELARANAELSQANRDLEDFASIIAHDLGAPMRAMRDMTLRLEARVDAGAEPDPEMHAAIDRLKEQTQRLSSMLRDLHEYSSIGRKQDAMEIVDMDALVGRIVRSIPRPDGFAITVAGDWPRIETLVPPLDLVLRNLIDNAVKHHDRADGRIEITGALKPEVLEITIADDGPGIPAERRAAAFLPFRTLAPAAGKSRSQAPGSGPGSGPGTGMGLAFVKRTIETVGGRMSLASVPELPRGTRFVVIWPLAIAANPMALV